MRPVPQRSLPLLVGVLVFAPATSKAAPTEPLELVNGLVRVEECEYCHSFNNAPVAADDPLYAPYFTWRGSMMANAAVDPVFWAGVAIASQDATTPVETEACIRCHAPRAFLEGRGDAIAIDELDFADLAGVECELCHRAIADAPPGNATYTLDDSVIDGAVPRRGPWAYPASEGIPPPPHSWIVDPFTGSSELCGTCHDVTTARQRVDSTGTPMGIGFGEQRTYSEWAGSAFAVAGNEFRGCQDCHMPAVDDAPGCRENVGAFQHETGARRHDLLGANRFVVELLAEQASLVEGVAFDHTLSQIDDFLRSSATLELTGPTVADPAAGLSDIVVTVTNDTGHKLPTGYAEGREMWLEVLVTYDDQLVWSSGRWDEQAGSVQNDAQRRIYRGVAQQFSTGRTLHLLLNDNWIEDTRIPPKGLMPNVETDPVTDRYEIQADGSWANFDRTTYAFAASDQLAGVDAGELNVAARLLYLVNTPDYIEFLASANKTNTAGDDVAMAFDEAGGATPVVLAAQSLAIPLEAAPSGSSGSAGASGSTTADSGSGDVPTTGSTGSDPATLSGSTSSSDTGDTDAAADEATGCGCSSSNSPGGRGLMLIGVVAAAGLRRKRRHA